MVWGPDPVRFEGRFYQIAESEIGPKPVQPGGPPILVGAVTPPSIERAARMGLGLNPVLISWDGLRDAVETFRRAATSAGRDPSSLPVVVRVNGSITTKPLDERAPLPDRSSRWPKTWLRPGPWAPTTSSGRWTPNQPNSWRSWSSCLRRRRNEPSSAPEDASFMAGLSRPDVQPVGVVERAASRLADPPPPRRTRPRVSPPAQPYGRVVNRRVMTLPGPR